MAWPPRLLAGVSDVDPSDLRLVLTNVTRVVLSDGSAASPLFSGAAPDQAELLGEVQGAAFRHLSMLTPPAGEP